MGGHGAIPGACKVFCCGIVMPARQLKFYYAPWLSS
jgi:hypothetical protein